MLEPVGLPDAAIVQPAELVGMSSKSAAAQVLRKAQRPLTTREILRLLKRGGLALNGAHANNTLRRALHADESFYYVRPGYWSVRDTGSGSEESPSDG